MKSKKVHINMVNILAETNADEEIIKKTAEQFKKGIEIISLNKNR